MSRASTTASTVPGRIDAHASAGPERVADTARRASGSAWRMIWFSLLVLIPLAMVVATARPVGWAASGTRITQPPDAGRPSS